MKKMMKIAAALAAMVMAFSFIGCDNEDEDEYEIGDEGPGRGIVFYHSKDGFTVSINGEKATCHYLECSPESLGNIAWCPCSEPYCNVVTSDGIGDGKDNTLKIIKATHYGESVDASNCAAYACNEYSTETTEKGDWYLPSKTELGLIYENLVEADDIISSKSWHWSSSQYSTVNVWDQKFSNGEWGYSDDNIDKDWTDAVRAVHAF